VERGELVKMTGEWVSESILEPEHLFKKFVIVEAAAVFIVFHYILIGYQFKVLA